MRVTSSASAGEAMGSAAGAARAMKAVERMVVRVRKRILVVDWKLDRVWR